MKSALSEGGIWKPPIPLKTGEETPQAKGNPACPFSASNHTIGVPGRSGVVPTRRVDLGQPSNPAPDAEPAREGEGSPRKAARPRSGPLLTLKTPGMEGGCPDFARTSPPPCALPADLEPDEAFLPGMEARQVDLLKGFLAQPEIHPVRRDRELEGDRLVGFRHLAWEEELGQGSSPSCCFVLGDSHNLACYLPSPLPFQSH